MGRSHRRSSSRDRDRYRSKDKSRERSREKDRGKDKSRDRSRERDRGKDKSRDRSRDRRDKNRDRDRDYYRRRSRSRSRSKSYYSSSSRSKKSKKSYRRSSSSSSDDGRRSSRSMSRSIKSRSITRAKSSDKYTIVSSTSTASEPPSKPLKGLEILENRLNSTVLGTIEEDSFNPQAFVSSGGTKKVSEKVYINLNDETMKLPVPDEKVHDDTIENLNFNPQFLGDEQTKMDKWVKKLYNYRKREAFL